LACPNLEIKQTLAQHILLTYTSDAKMSEIIYLSSTFGNAIIQTNAELFSSAVKGIISKIPYQIHNDNEAYYHSVLLVSMGAMGFDVRAEVSVGTGRADIVWEYEKYIVIIELKHLKSDGEEIKKELLEIKKLEIEEKLNILAEQAVQQIKDKEYYAGYKNKKWEKIVLVGTAVDGKCKLVASRVNSLF
jgi:hypothetical protein